MARQPKNPSATEQSVSVNLPTELVARIDEAAKARVVGRGFLLTYFITTGLAQLPPLPGTTGTGHAGQPLDLTGHRPEVGAIVNNGPGA